MATEFKIPNLGDGIKGGDVLNVLVKVGDTVAKDQGVLELETDKATIEVPSSVAGTVSEIKVKSGDKVTIGQVVLTLERRRIVGRGQRPVAFAREGVACGAASSGFGALTFAAGQSGAAGACGPSGAGRFLG